MGPLSVQSIFRHSRASGNPGQGRTGLIFFPFSSFTRLRIPAFAGMTIWRVASGILKILLGKGDMPNGFHFREDRSFSRVSPDPKETDRT
jgi:hypothetical protein